MKNKFNDFIENYFKSNIERAKARPFFDEYEEFLKYQYIWRKSKIKPDNQEYEIYDNIIYPNLKKLLFKPDKKLIGYSFEEKYLLNELYPLYNTPNGHVNTNLSVKKIAHISDLHILWSLNKTKEGNYYDDSILEQIKKSIDTQTPDLIVLTGDITDDGLGYMKFYKTFKNYINQGRVITIPGNHDINSLGITKFSSGFKYKDYQEFSRIVMGKREYADFFVFEFKNLIVAGANSSAKINLNLFDNAIGFVDLKKFKNNINLPQIKKKKIFVLHHHLEKIQKSILDFIAPDIEEYIENFMKLENEKEVMDFCKEKKIDLLLHGHKHISYEKTSKYIPQMKIFGAPSTTIDKFYHIIEINEENISRIKIEI